MSAPPREGETYTHERTFTREDVAAFAEVTRDTQPRHTEPDEEGRLLVHGLLTGSLLTSIGGDLEMLAREMAFEYRRPVYTGDTVRCEWTNDSVEAREGGGWDVEAAVEFHRVGDGELVLSATVSGLVPE